MNFDLWLVFLGGAVLSAVLLCVGAILMLNHAFQRGDSARHCRLLPVRRRY